MKSVKPKAAGRRGRGWGWRLRPAAGERAQPRHRFSGREALQRDPRLDHRSRGAALSQGSGEGGEAELCGPCLDGEPERSHRERLHHRRGRPCRAESRRLAMIEQHADRPEAITLGADRGYDAEDFVNELRSMNVDAPCREERHAPTIGDRRAGRRATPAMRSVSVSAKRIEEGFGWMKTIGGQAKSRYRGCDRVGWSFHALGSRLQSHQTSEAIGRERSDDDLEEHWPSITWESASRCAVGRAINLGTMASVRKRLRTITRFFNTLLEI